MAAVWGTKKSWTSHFNDTSTPWTDATKAKNTQPVSPPAMLHKSSLSAKTSWLRRGRGIVFELEPVPVDPAIDPDWDLCFNCWKPDHSHKECKHPKYYDYCRNCGRRGVNWTTCPRCAKGYVDYQKWRVSNNRAEFVDYRERPIVPRPEVQKVNANKSFPPEYHDVQKEFPVIKPPLANDESKNIKQQVAVPASKSENQMRANQLPVGVVHPSERNEAREISANEDIHSNPNGMFYSRASKDIALENCANHTVRGTSNSLGESTISSENEDYNLDDDDLEHCIVDEEEMTLQEPDMSGTIQDFMCLMELTKLLPMETQHKVLDQFLEERRLTSVGSKMDRLINGFH